MEADNNTPSGPYLKTAIYIRVSTSMQVDKDSLPMQRNDLETYSKLILGITDFEVFEDAGYSGKNIDRPAYQDMIARIRKGEFTHLLVWKIDRISRNLIDFSNMWEELKKYKVAFVSKQEQFDTSTAIGEAMLKIILVFAELERKMTGERVHAAMISRANKGIWNGGKIPFGYDYDSDTGIFSINEKEAEVCRFIADTYIKCRSFIRTAKIANDNGYLPRSGKAWSQSTVRLILQNPFYTGVYRYNKYHGTEKRILNNKDEWIFYEGQHPAIFSPDLQDKIMKISHENYVAQNTEDQQAMKKYIHVYSKICYCGKCGARMSAASARLHNDGYRPSIYGCSRRKTSHACDNKSIIDIYIGEFAINMISNIFMAKKSFSEIGSPAELESRLLSGKCFEKVSCIDHEGLLSLYDILSRFKSDKSFTLIPKKREKTKSAINTEVNAIKKELDRHKRALDRLNELYLYSDDGISEKEYLLRRQDISSKISDLNKKLGGNDTNNVQALTDEEFIKKASHLIINTKLQDKAYINYKEFASSVSTEILYEYIHYMIKRIYITDSRITSIIFNNDLKLDFIYK